MLIFPILPVLQMHLQCPILLLEGQTHAHGYRQERHPTTALVRAGHNDAGLTATGAGHSRTPPSRLPRFLPPQLHRSPRHISMGWQLPWDVPPARDVPWAEMLQPPEAFPKPSTSLLPSAP